MDRVKYFFAAGTLVGLALLFGAGIWSLRSGCTDSRARASPDISHTEVF